MIRDASKLSTYQASGRKCKVLFSEEKTNTKECSVFLVEFEPGEGTPVHTHDGIELMFVIDGEGVAIENGEQINISKNCAMLAPKGVPHQVVNGTEKSMQILCAYVPPLSDSYISKYYKKID